MKVTAIKAQVKQQGRYSIFIEGEYAFSLGATALLDSKVVVGMELTGEDLKSFKQLSGDDKLYNLALRYAAMRPRSTWEMQTYLKRKDASPPLSEQILNKLNILHMLDDVSFAESWVSSRRLLKPVSRRRLQSELQQKHVPCEVIEQVLAVDAEESDERVILRELVERKRRQTKYRDPQKLMQYLAGQGFNYDDIKAAVSNLSDS